MNKSTILLPASLLLFTSCHNHPKQEGQQRPNIVVIYMDDLGYGDVGAYGSTALKTPNIDKLAEGGIQFTDGHASSATCTPSRYALLTGEYPWRNRDAKILPGSAPLIIDTAKITLPKMLRENGYHTAVVGKWHLGLGYGNVDWNLRVSPGPNEIGFDYSYIMAATQDRVPTVYLENGQVEGLESSDPLEVSYQKNFDGEPTGLENPELCKKMMWHYGHNGSINNGIPRIGFQRGGKSALWIDEDMADIFLARAQQYIKSKKEESFFLYYALQQPHVPRTPHPRFVGSSGMGPRGDVIVEADWCVGELMNTLEAEGLLENTLVIFSSDNGPVLNDGYFDDAEEKLGDHTPRGPLRGGKYSLYEAGTRLPFITFWKGKIQPGVSNALISQLDLFSSIARLVGSDTRVPDSEELLDVLMGKSQIGRKELVMEATSRTAFRKGDWVMIPPYSGQAFNEEVKIELGNSPEFQLFNLKDDIGQQNNLAKSNPEKLQELITDFKKIRGEGFMEIEALELN